MIKKILRILLRLLVGLGVVGGCLLISIGVVWLGEYFGLFNILCIFVILTFAYSIGAVILD